jgi:putative ABC transport system permease protein
MNLFSLVFKQMRQRALGTWLTLLSVVLGVSLAIVILILYREAFGLFGQTDYGYDVLIGKKGSGTQLVLNTVYMIDKSPGNIPYSMYEDLIHKREYRQYAKLVVPYVVGDSYEGRFRIIGTTPNLFGCDDEGKPLDAEHTMTYRPDLRYEFAEGRDFLPHKLEAVVGCDLATLPKVPLRLGTEFKATHGFPLPGQTPDIHKTVWKVVGVLKPTHTAADRAVFLPYEGLYTIGDHVVGLLAQQALHEGKPVESDIEMVNKLLVKQGLPPAPPDTDADDVQLYKQDPDGTIHLYLDKDAWEVSAILVKSRGGNSADGLMYVINNGNVAQAVRPATVMREFFDTFFKGPTLVLLVIAVLVTIVAAVGILVSIYNSVAARTREIAIIRALGATRFRVLVLICTEAGLIGLFGGVIGLVVAHVVAGAASVYLQRYLGQGIKWYIVDWKELCFVAGIVVIAVLAGFVPAAKAYRTDVATNLVSG